MGRAVRSTRPGYGTTDPSKVAKAPASQGAEAVFATGFGHVSPVDAAGTMHDNLAENAREIAHGHKNVPLHPAQVPQEGSDTNEFGGDGQVHDPSGIGWGT
jgi:hypothetical protein